jgi:hypothetical protein
MTYTDPAATDTDLAAIAACREATWPTAKEMYPDGEETEGRARDVRPGGVEGGASAREREADGQRRFPILA